MRKNYPELDDVLEEYKSDETLILEGVHAREQTNYALAVSAFLMGEQLYVRFSYDPKKYTAHNIEILKTHLETIAKQIADDASVKVSTVTAIDEKEQDVIINAFNNTTADYPSDKTIVDLVDELR